MANAHQYAHWLQRIARTAAFEYCIGVLTVRSLSSKLDHTAKCFDSQGCFTHTGAPTRQGVVTGLDQEKAELVVARRTCDKKLMATSGVTDPRIEEALASVPREHFLGPAPWKLGTEDGSYVEAPSGDPVHLYTGVLTGLDQSSGALNWSV
jgi:hypothetical protein